MYKHIKLPDNGEKISVNSDFTLNVPDNPVIPYIEGDGTGVDITPVMLKVVDDAVNVAYGGKRKIVWMEMYAGEKSCNVYGENVWFAQAWLDLNSIVVTCQLMAHPDILMCQKEERDTDLSVFQASHMISARLKSYYNVSTGGGLGNAAKQVWDRLETFDAQMKQAATNAEHINVDNLRNTSTNLAVALASKDATTKDDELDRPDPRGTVVWTRTFMSLAGGAEPDVSAASSNMPL